ncbi:MAG: response regulator [Elusimicrobia bacterium]|nr:response regulator [Elusimicrobiota bacterium]
MPEKMKVLLVDDNINFLQLAQMALSSEEYQVFTGANGQEGFDFAIAQHPDVILTDVMMPKVSGLEFLRMLLSEEETKNIPVIVMTASHFDPSTEMMFKQETNVKGFLQKPCPLNIMKDAIAQALKKQTP